MYDLINNLDVKAVETIRQGVGFSVQSVNQINLSIKGSSYLVQVTYENRPVAMSRLLWDTGSVAYICDLLVLPNHRNKGLEELMINDILNFISQHLTEDGGIQVDVKVWPHQVEIYQDLGFIQSTKE